MTTKIDASMASFSDPGASIDTTVGSQLSLNNKKLHTLPGPFNTNRIPGLTRKRLVNQFYAVDQAYMNGKTMMLRGTDVNTETYINLTTQEQLFSAANLPLRPYYS